MKFRRANIWDCMFVVLMVLLLAELCLRLFLDNQTPFFDPTGHYLDSLRTLLAPKDSDLLKSKPDYTPFVSIVAIPFNLLFGFQFKPVLFATEGFFLVVLLIATYGIGRHLFDRGTAFVAVLLLACYPAVYGQSEMFMHDIPLAALVTVTIWLVFLSAGFRTSWLARPIGIAFGLGMLTKFTYPLFVVPPLFFMAIEGLRDDWRKSRSSIAEDSELIARLQPLRDATIAAAVAIVVAGPWYFPKIWWLLGGRWDESASDQTKWNALYGTHTGENMATFLYYGRRLWVDTSLVLFVAFVVLAVAYFTCSKSGRLVLATWIIASAALLVLMPVFEPRFMIPSLPAVALITAAGLTSSCKRFPQLKSIFLVVFTSMMVFSVLQLYAESYGIKALPNGRPVLAVETGLDYPIVFSQKHTYVPRVTHPEFTVSRVVAALFNDIPIAGRPRVTVGIFTSPEVRSAFWLLLLKQNLLTDKIRVVTIDDPTRSKAIVDYVIEMEPKNDLVADADQYLVNLEPGVHYKELYRFDIGFSGEGPWISLLRRID